MRPSLSAGSSVSMRGKMTVVSQENSYQNGWPQSNYNTFINTDQNYSKNIVMEKNISNNCRTNDERNYSHTTTDDSHRRTGDSNLYAAEYLLYDFHFEEVLRPRQETAARAFMMMISEG